LRYEKSSLPPVPPEKLSLLQGLVKENVQVSPMSARQDVLALSNLLGAETQAFKREVIEQRIYLALQRFGLAVERQQVETAAAVRKILTEAEFEKFIDWGSQPASVPAPNTRPVTFPVTKPVGR
jgi:hypothetical protein